jgi:alpha-N-acetylglucosamine transferase
MALMPWYVIQVWYLPNESATQAKLNVGGSMFTKFHVYSMTEYQRVLYLDSDILPMANLDYLFDLSMQGVLKPTFLISGVYQLANVGFLEDSF